MLEWRHPGRQLQEEGQTRCTLSRDDRAAGHLRRDAIGPTYAGSWIGALCTITDRKYVASQHPRPTEEGPKLPHKASSTAYATTTTTTTKSGARQNDSRGRASSLQPSLCDHPGVGPPSQDRARVVAVGSTDYAEPECWQKKPCATSSQRRPSIGAFQRESQCAISSHTQKSPVPSPASCTRRRKGNVTTSKPEAARGSGARGRGPLACHVGGLTRGGWANQRRGLGDPLLVHLKGSE